MVNYTNLSQNLVKINPISLNLRKLQWPPLLATKLDAILREGDLCNLSIVIHTYRCIRVGLDPIWVKNKFEPIKFN